MLETRRLKNVVIFIQTILSFALSRKIIFCIILVYSFKISGFSRDKNHRDALHFLDNTVLEMRHVFITNQVNDVAPKAVI